jgi:hypothetical protein
MTLAVTTNKHFFIQSTVALLAWSGLGAAQVLPTQPAQT